MSNFVFGGVSAVQALLFGARDTLTFGSGINENNLSVTTGGVTTTLDALGTSLTLPNATFYQAGQSGLVTFLDGTHLFTGTTNGDDMTGTSGNEAIYGSGGDDRLDGAGGDDYVFGGTGSDTISGGDGNDHLYGFGQLAGPDSADSISGGAGNDYLQGNSGDDMLDGGDGNDRINGGADNDYITGGAGIDAINGNFGLDTIDGGAGDDIVRGGKGSDIVRGGDGNDKVYGDLGTDTVTGGAGADVFYFSGSDAALIDTNTVLGQVNSITDFIVGSDHLSFGFTPTAVTHGVASSLLDVLAVAQTLLDTVLGGSDVAAVQVGSDTYLVYNNSGTGLIADSLIELNGVNGNTIGVDSWI